MINLFFRMQKSVFARLIFIFSATILAAVIIFSLSFKMAFDQHTKPKEHHFHLLFNHINYIISDIGTPPNERKISELSETLAIKIMLKGPNKIFKTHTSMPEPTDIILKRTINESMSIGRYKNLRFIVFQQGQNTYYLTGLHPLLSEDAGPWLLAGFIATLLLLYLCYRMVKWLFYPLSQIKVGAEKISQGELSYRIDHNRKDEIGEITQSVNKMADELEKMIQAKHQLLLAISHELRTPLTRAKVGIEFIKEEEIKQNLNEELTELEVMINELLETERLNHPSGAALDKTLINLNAFITEIVNEYTQRQAQENLINLSLPKAPIEFNIDPFRFKILLKNLINNALKYSHHKPIEIALNQTQAFIRLSVKDKGEGIAAEHLNHLTEPFYRTDSARQQHTGGYGLGLYLCRLIVEAHEGHLCINSEPQKGTIVAVSLGSQTTPPKDYTKN